MFSGAENELGAEKQTVSKVPIKVDIGYPSKLEHIEVPQEFELAALLSLIKPDLENLYHSSRAEGSFIAHYQHKDRIFPYVGGAIFDASREVQELLEYANQYDLVRKVLSIDNNILGCYSFFPENSPSDRTPASATTGNISLFWGTIGLVAQALGVGIQNLSIVVLAHELAHAYTHLGCDTDGCKWDDTSWTHSEPAVIEGLAQFYTEKVLYRLRHRIPGCYEAYEKLLEKQNDNYHAHKLWIDDMKASSEAVRLTLISLRKGRKVWRSQFNEFLRENVQKLRT